MVGSKATASLAIDGLRCSSCTWVVERVLEKTIANFCQHFRPRPDAHRPPENPELDKATAALGDLFGIEGGAATVIETPPEGPKQETADSARRQLEQLFGLQHEERAADDPQDRNEVGEEEDEPDDRR